MSAASHSSAHDQATSYGRFLLRCLRLAFDGKWQFYTWMGLLSAVWLVGLHAWAIQVRDGMIVCTGLPIGVMRTDRQYENFVLEIEWRHMEAGGNSGVFLWSDAKPDGNRLPRGMEVQMLELDWVRQHRKKDGTYPPVAYVQGELFGAGGMTAIPANPRGSRSKSLEHRCKGVGQWNKYTVVAVDGTVKLAINGRFVNSIRDASWKKGYICLESEGREIHMRNIRIMELPPGMADEATTAPVIKSD